MGLCSGLAVDPGLRRGDGWTGEQKIDRRVVGVVKQGGMGPFMNICVRTVCAGLLLWVSGCSHAKKEPESIAQNILKEKTMDIAKRDQLLSRVGDVNSKDTGLVLVTLEEFFEGNNDRGSIWCNLPEAPEPQMVFEVLKMIRARKDVADVRIMVTQYDGGEDEWPFSDTVYFIMSATPDDAKAWFGELYYPDEIWIDDFSRAGKIPVPEGMHAVAAWWD